MHFIQFLLEHWEGECVKTRVLFMCNLSALHTSQGFETGKSLPKERDEAVCYFSPVSFNLCTCLVFSLFLCPLLPLCSVAAAQDCVTGPDKVVETLISLSFELPGHSSLFHLETWYGERIPTLFFAKPPGPRAAIWSQCIEGSPVSQAGVTPLQTGGNSGRRLFWKVHLLLHAVCVQPYPSLRDQIQALLLCLGSVRIWLLLSMTAE